MACIERRLNKHRNIYPPCTSIKKNRPRRAMNYFCAVVCVVVVISVSIFNTSSKMFAIGDIKRTANRSGGTKKRGSLSLDFLRFAELLKHKFELIRYRQPCIATIFKNAYPLVAEVKEYYCCSYRATIFE